MGVKPVGKEGCWAGCIKTGKGFFLRDVGGGEWDGRVLNLSTDALGGGGGGKNKQ